MNAEQIIVDNKEYYFNKDTLDDPKVIRVFLFEDPKLEHVSKNEDGLTKMVSKDRIVENINEFGGGGAGYAVYGGGARGGFGNSRGGGFGQSSSNNGGANLMYTYSIKPLNQTLQQPVNLQEEGEYIHVGSEVKGKILGKNQWIEAKVLSIEEDSDNNISSFTVINPKTGKQVKLDPTSCEPLKKELSPDMVVRDIVGENFYPSFKEFLNEKEA